MLFFALACATPYTPAPPDAPDATAADPAETAFAPADSLGAGIRFNVRGNVSGFVEGAVPNRIVAAENRRVARLFTGVQVNF